MSAIMRSLRKIFLRPGLLAVSALIAFSAAAHPALQLGGNINENWRWVTPQALAQTQTQWLRGFVPASAFIRGQRDYQHDPGLLALKQAADSGHKIILSLKWDSNGKGRFGSIPRPGSQEEQQAFNFCDRLLQTLSGKLSALVLVNELTIDTRPADLRPGADGRIPVLVFLRRLTAHIAAHHPLAADGRPLPLYAGGLTRVDRPAVQNAKLTRRMLRWANHDARITGVDYHLHQPDISSARSAAAFVHRQVPHKPLMVTELSLIHAWKKHLPDKVAASPAGAAFVARQHLPPQITVAQYLTLTLRTPVSQSQWDSFITSQRWFTPHYLQQMLALMKANGVKIATYGLIWRRPQQINVITPATTPWMLTQVLIPAMVRPSASGSMAVNGPIFNDYIHYQRQR